MEKTYDIAEMAGLAQKVRKVAKSVRELKALQDVFPQNATTFRKTSHAMLRHPMYFSSSLFNRILRGLASSNLTEIETPSIDAVSKAVEDKKEIKPLVIPGLTSTQTRQIELFQPKFSEIHEQQIGEDDWPAVWPCENFFSPYVFPVPIRQGHSKNLVENGGLSPAKYANAELLKIPNFLHLTPRHIEKHCKALQKFTTKWPSGLRTDEDVDRNYPVEVVTHSFTNSAPSIRDKRARRVTIRVSLKCLNLDERGRLKLLRLAKAYGFERGMAQFYSDQDVLELTSERCPASHQNYDYLIYVFTVLTMESKKHEPWEDEETGSYLDFKWERSKHRKRISNLLGLEGDSSKMDDVPAVKAYREALEAIFHTPTEENTGPWQHPRRQPKRRHYHWPEIKDVVFEPVVGADVQANLEAYGSAVKRLYTEKTS
ncbi:28S ribosomal protein S35 [Echinococcus granulosus]|uniref:28S ribosomal protein S35 n=2 Tax=Echinococcus granulosus TaxID=6210 RepID=W6UYR6_ECHGR|nr:28S ribosomal protein S35 [Echinococcus granulosus]EUB58729.1 28S ribosomal protein S35 [Echinococcus granulosus]